ncbi:MAG: NfeD family protein [Verrucomicrobiota bacterium]
MSFIILLFSIGLVLLALEVIIPGGILGIIGGVVLFTGCVFSFFLLGTLQGLIAIAIAVFAGILIFYIQFKILPNTRLGKRFFLKREISGSANSLEENTRDLIGKTATSVTVLSPSGYVLVDGTSYEAVSQSGQIPKNTELLITAANSFQLTVKTKS